MATFETKVERLAQQRVQCTVTYTPDQTKKAEEAALQRLGRNVRIDGFRPGHAPADALKGRIDKGQLLEETIRALLPDTIKAIAAEHKVVPVIPPKIEAIQEEPLQLRITFVEKPAVTLKNVDKIKVDKREPKVDDKDIDRVVETLLVRLRTSKEVQRAAAMGDEVTLNFWGEDREKKPVEGMRAEQYKAILGKKALLPGFEEALVGMKAGEQKSFVIPIPEKHQLEHMRGKPVTFHASLTKVEEVSMPALTDALAEEKFGVPTAAKLREDIGQSLKMQEEDSERARRENTVLDELRKAVQVDLAPELVDAEVRVLLNELQGQLDSQNQTLNDWIKASGKTVEQVEAELKTRAEQRLQLRFGLEKLVETKNVAVTEDEVNKVAAETLSTIPPEQRDGAAKFYAKGEDGWLEIEWRLKVERALATLLA